MTMIKKSISASLGTGQ